MFFFQPRRVRDVAAHSETAHSETAHSETVHSETVHSETVHSETVLAILAQPSSQDVLSKSTGDLFQRIPCAVRELVVLIAGPLKIKDTCGQISISPIGRDVEVVFQGS